MRIAIDARDFGMLWDILRMTSPDQFDDISQMLREEAKSMQTKFDSSHPVVFAMFIVAGRFADFRFRCKLHKQCSSDETISV